MLKYITNRAALATDQAELAGADACSAHQRICVSFAPATECGYNLVVDDAACLRL